MAVADEHIERSFMDWTVLWTILRILRAIMQHLIYLLVPAPLRRIYLLTANREQC